MRDSFSALHPAVNALYFVLVLGVGVISFHPVLLVISLGCGLIWHARLGRGIRPLALAVVFLASAALNPLFSHEGTTILAYFPSGNPLTLESILYGLGAGLMLLTALVWCSCLSRVMTADKWMCLTGRAAPALSLLLSMTLRFVPRFRRRLKEIRQGQRGLGQTAGGSPLRHAELGVRQLSILMTWSLEAAVSTADSMAGRGYGLPGRTVYTPLRLEGRDRRALAFLACAGGYLLLMALRGTLDWRFYPTVRGAAFDLWSISAVLVWLALCALPIYLGLREEREWKHIVSNS